MSESRENEERKETQANISDLGARQLPLHISLVAASAVDVFTRMAMSFPPTLFSFSLSLSFTHLLTRAAVSAAAAFAPSSPFVSGIERKARATVADQI